MENDITFVTAIVDIYNENHYNNNTKNLDFRIEQFRYIANTNVPLCVYVCVNTRPYIEKLIEEGYTNIKIMDEMYNISNQFLIFNMLFSQKQNLNLPIIRTEHKDTFEYLTLMHCKIDFIENTMNVNPWNHENFAWIDFNIMHVGKSQEEKFCLQKYLCDISQLSGDYLDKVVVPGCWPKGSQINYVAHQINWRFCGGFFIGNNKTLREFYDLYTLYLPEFLATYNTMVWEVNFWSWLECEKNWSPLWYESDHNQKILEVPFIMEKKCNDNEILTLNNMCDIASTLEYVKKQDFVPSSSAYIFYNGEHLLNVRYVNYMMDDNGYYHYRDHSNIVKTQNHLYHLDMDIIPSLQENKGGWMNENKITLEKYQSFSQGIEDIRLYEFKGKLRFIATTIQYYSTNGARMMVGDYDHNNMAYDNVKIIDSPTNSFFEKNWAPIIGPSDKELLVYSWNPMRIGEIDGNTLIFTKTYDTNHLPLLQKCKGSTCFFDNGDNTYIGTVHYNTDTFPRQYYHMIVILDANLQPIKASSPFVFFKHSIEFCIGMAIRSHSYVFFISQMDRSPMNIIMRKESLYFQSISQKN